MDQALRAIHDWRSRGRWIDAHGRAVFAVDEGDGRRCAVLLHGFPGSSFDWRRVIPLLSPHARVVAFDFLGFGLSDKPLEGAYAVSDQADLTERLLKSLGVERCLLVGQDLGETVAAELLRRVHDGRLGVDVEAMILLGGAVLAEPRELPSGQRLLLSMPDEPLPMPLPLEVLLPDLSAAFSREHQPSREDLEAMLWLVGHREGDRLLPRLIRHVEERRRAGDRWTAALLAFAGPLAVVWGEQDPLAGPGLSALLEELRPETAVLPWPDVGHWPALEVPDRLGEAILDRLERLQI